MLKKDGPHLGNDKTIGLFCDYRFINHICKIRLLRRLINCKLTQVHDKHHVKEMENS